MPHINVTAWMIALIVTLLPCAANAVGLGRLAMLSNLGDPLHVEIDLVSVTKEEMGSLSARLSGPDAYRQANLQYNAALVGARVSIERRPSGQSFVRIRSTRPVNEPFIDMLVEITSSSGRLVREYTVLVDPPGVAPPPTTAAAPPAAVARPAPVPEPPVTAPPAAVRRPAAAAPVAGAKEYGPVQRGENLTKIAQSVMHEGVTLEQMLVGLYRSNPDAFINKNLNLVKSGKILRVPEKEEVASLAPAEARKEFRAQVADWNSYRQSVASGAAPARTEGRTTTGGRISTKVEDKAGGDPKDVVRLSRGEPPGAAKGKPRSTAERVRALEEEVIARDKALNEANERIAQLEKTLKDMQKLVELKSPGMAAAQQKAEQAAKAKAAEAKPEAKPEAKKAEPAKPEAKAEPKPEAKPDAVAAAKPDAAKPEPAKPEAPKAAAAKPDAAAPPAPDAKAEAKGDAKADAPKADQAKAPEEPKAKPKVVAPPPPPPPDLMDQVMEAATDPLYLGAGAGALVLGGLAFWVARRRRRDAGDEEPRKAAPVLGKKPEAEADAGAGMAAAAASTTQMAAAPAADDVDPLAEAEVYIAYGRDAQAEEILKEALAKNPQRQDAQLKLLEIYAARKDKAAFNKLAADFNKQTGGTGANWLPAAAMGYALDPGNALYEAGKHAPAAPTAGAAPASDLDFELGGDTTGVATDITLDSGFAQPAHDTTAILDVASMPGHDSTAIMDAGELQRMAAEAQKEPEPLMPDFSLDIPGTAAPAAPVTQTDIALDAAPPTQDGHMIDFQIELPKAADAPDQTQVNATAAPVTDAGGLDFKLDIPDLDLGDKGAQAGAGGEKDGHWYDVQTKFDLAKAYQEMGDKDGAKEILQEVIKEGDAEQQAEAKKLLDSLA